MGAINPENHSKFVENHGKFVENHRKIVENDPIFGEKLLKLSDFRKKPSKNEEVLLIPVTAGEIARKGKVEFIKLLPLLPEALTVEVVALTDKKERLEFILQHTPHSDIRHALAYQLGVHLIIDGQDLTFASPAVRDRALKKHLWNLANLFPTRMTLCRDLELAEQIFKDTYLFEATPEVAQRGAAGSPQVLKWLSQNIRSSGSFPQLDNLELPEVFLRRGEKKGELGTTMIPNIARVRQAGVNLIAWGLSEVLSSEGGTGFLNEFSHKWYYVGKWATWGYSKSTGYWSNPRGRISLRKCYWEPSVVLFGSSEGRVNICGEGEHLDLNPRHWEVARER